MVIDVEGVTVKPEFEALQSGEGFVVKLKTEWFPDRMNHELTQEQRNAIQQAKDQGIIGWRLNGHEATFADVLTRLQTEQQAFANEIVAFIDNFNNPPA